MKRAGVNIIMRPLCKCGKKPVAINYYKEGVPYYRSLCENCAKHGGKKRGPSKYELAGYLKKNSCDKCNFRSKHSEQFHVYYVDGDLNNVRTSNLKTVCANCSKILYKEGVTWKQGDLVPDF